MNNALLQDTVAQGPTSGRVQMIPTRQIQSLTDSSASKRVCFYKSGDYKFIGHRMIINVRTFKTFDALVDTLSKKVPLPFGVRTIATPRGTHLVKNLDDLHDGGSYVCSDQRQVKPFNLSKLNWRQIPWNTTRPLSARAQKRLQFGQSIRRDDVVTKPTKVTDRVAVRTPKRLVVIKNKDPTVKHALVLHRKTAPTFEALLDHLSQILRFPVLKLYSTDGRRVDGLAALILCSGVVVAAGSEMFKPGNYSVHRKSQMKKAVYVENVENVQARAQNRKSTSSGRCSTNFSLSSERYIVSQINKSLNGSADSRLQHNDGRSCESEENQCNKSVKTCETGSTGNKPCGCILPHEDDIEKSFCVNQDGSMTVEMKVHLTVKEEEMLHWTTTLSRASLTKNTDYTSVSQSVNRFTDSNCIVAKNVSNVNNGDCGEGNCPSKTGKDVCFHEEQVKEDKTIRKKKSRIKRPPTPGLRRVQKTASVEGVEVVTESGVQDSSVGHYCNMNRTPDGETRGGYCIIRHSSCSSSSSNRPTLKAEKIASARTENQSSSNRSAEGLQVENTERQVTETKSHLCESDGSCNSYLVNKANNKVSAGLHDHAVDSTPCNEAQLSHTKQEKILSNNLSRGNDSQKAPDPQTEKTILKSQSQRNKTGVKPARNNDSSKNSIRSSADKLSGQAGVRKKTSSSAVNPKKGQKSKVENEKIEKPQSKKSAVFNGYNVNTPTVRPQMKKSISDIFKTRKTPLFGKKTVNKPRSIIENLTDRTEVTTQFNRNISNSSLNPTPSEIHQYVENWLEGVSKERVSCAEVVQDEPRSKVVFEIGGDSETDEGSRNGNLDSCPAERDLFSGDVPEKQTERHLLLSEQKTRGLCVSMPSVRRDHEHADDHVKECKSAEAIGSTDASSSSRTNTLNAKANISVLRQLSSSFQCVGRASDVNTTPDLQRSNSLPDFPTQVALVFGSSCRAFLTFLTLMTLRDCLRESDDQSRKSSEAEQMMKTLMRISDIEDEEEQKTSLTSLQSRASRTFEEHWRNFQVLEGKTPSNNMSAGAFGLDAASAGGAVFDNHSLDELMDQLNVPPELRDEISLTILQAIGFQKTEDRPSAEPEGAQTDPRTHATHSEQEKMISQTEADVILLVTQEKSKLNENEEQVEAVEEQSESREENKEGRTKDEGERPENKAEEEEREGEAWDEAEEVSDRESVGKETKDSGEEKQTVEKSKDKLMEEADQDVEMKERVGTSDGEYVNEEEEEMDRDEGRTDEEQSGEECDDEIEISEGIEREGVEDVSEGVDDDGEEEENVEQEGEEEEEEGISAVVTEDRIEKVDLVCDENNREKGENGEENLRMLTSEEEEIEEEEEERGSEVEKGHNLEEESAEENKIEESKSEDDAETKQLEAEKENGNPLDEEVHRESNDEAEERLVHGHVDNMDDKEGDRNLLEEALYLQQNSPTHEEACVKENAGASTRCSSEGLCENTQERGQDGEERLISLSRPGGISQDLLDFVNSALQSSSLTFTYDIQGNIKLVPENAQVVDEGTYGWKRLPSPSTSDLSDYRPETSESRGYKSQESVEIVTESERAASGITSSDDGHEDQGRRTLEPAKLSSQGAEEHLQSSSSKQSGSSYSAESDTKDSTDDVSGFGAASSLKADSDAAPQASRCISSTLEDDTAAGVLIDRGRWLLKENHLIRRSPPDSNGMYDDADSSSVDTGQEVTSEDSLPPPQKNRANLLAAISSSEVEEMAKPLTLKCNFFNMSHGSDSDPFLDDSVVHGRTNQSSGVKGRALRVSPADTPKAVTNKSNSMSSFASVEFKMPDGKVHPEGESSVITQPRRTSSGGRLSLQSHDPTDSLRVRCGQYCPII